MENNDGIEQLRKTERLLRLMGWAPHSDQITTQWFDQDGNLVYDDYCGGLQNHTPLNLYHPSFMRYAWDVVHWAVTSENAPKTNQPLWDCWEGAEQLFYEDSSTAPSTWLDKVLEWVDRAALED